MNINQILAIAGKKLEKKGIDDCFREAEIILSLVLKKPREFLFAYPEKKISLFNKLKFNFLLNKRLGGWPNSYVTKKKEFYGFSFFVNKNVLIPRPETELMVSSIINIQYSIFNLIDVGTGSGCVIISIIKEIKNKIKKAIAIDVSKKALAVAKKNAKRLNVYKDIEFIKSDLLDGLIRKGDYFAGATIIAANLPYLTPKQVKDSPSIKKEPQVALVAGDDGFFYYKRLFKQIKDNLEKFQGSLLIFCEIDESQSDKIKQIINKEFPEAEIEIKKDLQNFNRLAVAKIK